MEIGTKSNCASHCKLVMLLLLYTVKLRERWATLAANPPYKLLKCNDARGAIYQLFSSLLPIAAMEFESGVTSASPA
jgi:hypothetical protein